ncbi:MAG: hypothetical protein AMJ73_05055 [candidate division Zixibacteria bacterium SM1_73]|nr:MAG: hypothetical protein AMJ73_05055 [candidate division Zixibacteria bacterium SM1_73]
MLKPLKAVFGMVLFLLFVDPVLQILSEAEVFARAVDVDTTWVRRYNGPENGGDNATAIAVDDSGYVYVTGFSKGSGTGCDYTTIKYNQEGDTVWVRRYHGPGNGWDYPYAIDLDGSGNAYVTGRSKGSGTDYDYTTIKYNPDGDTVWVRRYNGLGNGGDEAYAITVDDSSNAYVTGGSVESEWHLNYTTIKYHPNGDTAWVRRYCGPGNSNNFARAITVDRSYNVYVTGSSWGSETEWDYAIIKYYPDGDTAWVRRYNGPANGYDEAFAIAVDDSNNVYVTGYSSSTGAFEDYATIKYCPNGDTAWARRYNGPENDFDEAYAIVVDASGNVYVTGMSVGGVTNFDYATIKYYSGGDTAWVRRYNGQGNSWDQAFAIAVDDSGNVYVTGVSGVTGSYDYATIKYLPNGSIAWVTLYNGPGNGTDWPSAVAVDDSYNVYITGHSDGGSGIGYDYCTIKYVQTSSDVEDETGDRQKPSEFGLSQNYPNPFNPTTKIEFTLAKSGFVTLHVYDVLGRKVRTLVLEELSSGYKSVIWDGKNDDGKDVASGVYFYQLKVGDFSEPKKMVLLK